MSWMDHTPLSGSCPKCVDGYPKSCCMAGCHGKIHGEVIDNKIIKRCDVCDFNFENNLEIYIETSIYIENGR
jgi:hypothetical protein